MKCFQNLSEEQKLVVFKKFYFEFNGKDEQDIYLQGLIEAHDVKRRSKPKDENTAPAKQKSCSFFHYVYIDGQKRKVCQNAFISLHGIGLKRLKRIKSLLQRNSTPHDKRGTNPKKNAIPEEENILIRQHIESFPIKETHYSNKDYYYLDSKLSLKIMHRLYTEKHPNTRIRYSYNVKYFHEHYNHLHFGRPQVDTCCKCEELNVKIKSPSLGENDKRAAVVELMIHKRRAKKFFTSLRESTNECKNRDDLMVLTFDFMQNVHLPEIPVQEMFYLTQLSVNVFSIHNCKTGQGFFYVYQGLPIKDLTKFVNFYGTTFKRKFLTR